MAWSTAQVARMSKVTSRTLRHYDEIGLLPPARVGGNGYRYYELAQLLALQEILVLRQLGLPLDTIKQVVRDGGDRVAALRRHHSALLVERDRFGRLADTVAQTIRDLEKGEQQMGQVNVAHWFEGFDAQTQATYEAEAAERWGVEAVEASRERAKGLDQDQVLQEWATVLVELAEQIESGAQPGDERVQEVVDRHYAWVRQFWTPDGDAYAGLGDLYADDPRFRKRLDRTHPRLAEFLRDAMAAYATARIAR